MGHERPRGQGGARPGLSLAAALPPLPLTAAGLLPADHPVAIQGFSGYSGGGRALVDAHEQDQPHPMRGAYLSYGLDLGHKHLPEIMHHAGLSARPVFAPSVGRFAQRMAVHIPLHLNGRRIADLRDALSAHYDGAQFVQVVDAAPRIVPTTLNDTNMMELSVHGSDDNGVAVLVAVLDNLGKGASGAAVQNLNLMIGADEAAGL